MSPIRPTKARTKVAFVFSANHLLRTRYHVSNLPGSNPVSFERRRVESGREGQSLAAERTGQLRQGTSQKYRRQQRGHATVVAPVETPDRPRCHARLGRGGGQGRRTPRRHRRRRQDLQDHRRRQSDAALQGRRQPDPLSRRRVRRLRLRRHGTVGPDCPHRLTRPGEGLLRYRRGLRLVARRGPQDASAVRRHGAEGPHPAHHTGRQGERVL